MLISFVFTDNIVIYNYFKYNLRWETTQSNGDGIFVRGEFWSSTWEQGNRRDDEALSLLSEVFKNVYETQAIKLYTHYMHQMRAQRKET